MSTIILKGPLSRIKGLTRSHSLIKWEKRHLARRKVSIKALEEHRKRQAQERQKILDVPLA